MKCLILPILGLLLSPVASSLIPREVLFAPQKYNSPSLSPDGRFLAFIGPDERGIGNVYTKCVSCKHTRQVTFEKETTVLSYQWTAVKDIILYTQDNHGDENVKIFKKNISQEAVSANPLERTVVADRPRVRAEIFANNLKDPFVLVGLNDENPMHHNVYRFDLLTNDLSLLIKNKRFQQFVFDHDAKPRLAWEELQNGSIQYYKLSDKANRKALNTDKESWIEYLNVLPEDKPTTRPIMFDKTNENMYWLWGKDTDLGTLVTFPFSNPSNSSVLYTATRAQIGNIFFHPEDRTLLGIAEVYHKPELLVSNDTVMEDLQYLVNLRPHGSLAILSLSKDLNTWLVTYLSSDKPFEIFVYRRWIKTAELLFNTHPELEHYKLSKQVGFDFQTRDHMVLQAYLSLPPQERLKVSSEVSLGDKGYAELGMIPAKPQKLVLLVHGGPKARDLYGFNPLNALLTNRGYAVLQVNFRGSVGFGKRLTNAGNGEWARKMHYDLLDAVEFAVAKGIANRSQIAIMGGSYGGFATLVGLSFTPETFACGVDLFGPSNLVSLLQAVPPYWMGMYRDLVAMFGADITTEEGRQSLISRSPLFFAERVKKPILIMQGANDPRVTQFESDQFVTALKKNNIPVSYVLYPDEGHGFRKPNNSLSQYGYIDSFLHSCLGGLHEPFTVGQYESSAVLKSDAYHKEVVTTTSTTSTTSTKAASTALPTLAPQIFYRPGFNRFRGNQQAALNQQMIQRMFPVHG